MTKLFNIISIFIGSIWFYFLFNLLNENYSVYFWWGSNRNLIFYALHYFLLLATTIFTLTNFLSLFKLTKSDKFNNILLFNSLILIALTMPHTYYFAYATYYIGFVTASFYQLLLSVSLLFMAVINLFSALKVRSKF